MIILVMMKSLTIKHKQITILQMMKRKQVPYAAGKTFHQSLREQLNTFSLNEEDNAIAEFLVGSIDDSGYLRRDLSRFSR
jgi:DNA-directed RNA polymerase specialized sigma54-like protein